MLVVSKATTWNLPVASYMVIFTGVQFYQGKEHRYIAYPVMDVLQMMGRACRLMEDERNANTYGLLQEVLDPRASNRVASPDPSPP